MKKILALTLVAAMLLAVLAGCAGTTVVIGECNHTDAPVTPSDKPEDPVTTPDPSVGGDETALKTGLAAITSITDSTSFADGKDGAAKYEIVIAAVTVDDNGVIHSCIIDSVPATVNFDGKGVIVSDLTAAIRTKNEQGPDYGMVAWGGAIAEWNEQVAALSAFAVGKTVAELKSGAIDGSGKAPAGSDLASSATIYLGGYVSAVEAAVANAQHLGAKSGDKLELVSESTVGKSTSATAEKNGTAQLDSTIIALTHNNGVITSCYIDSVQAKVSFDANGTVTTDLSVPVRTKNEMGADYGMVAWGGAIAEWNEQAASFAKYVTGKTAAEVAGIAVTETTKPADGTDLASSVTITVGDFQSLIAKALQK